MPSSEQISECRRVCTSTPLRASIRITARSALEAPVAMLRVYCSWPGVSATMKERRGVAKKRYATSIVMRCCRSSSSPSSNREKSMSSPVVPKRFDSRSNASIWSASTSSALNSRRPISVDLPSSTEPQVRNRRRPRSAATGRAIASSGIRIGPASEIALALFALQRGIGVAVDQAALPFRAARLAQFGDDLSDRGRLGFDRAGQWIAAERAKPDAPHVGRLARLQGQAVVIDHDPRAAALHDGTFLGKIERHHIDAFRLDVLPDIELGPVREREYPHRFTRTQRPRSEEHTSEL